MDLPAYILCDGKYIFSVVVELSKKDPQYFTNACKTIRWFDDGLVGWINEYNSKSRQIDPFAIPFFQFLGYRGISRHPLYLKDLLSSQTHIVSPI